ncbi:serine/threonine-protein kinase, partial [Rubrivirga sp.]|uniref:serine/threonine-protein kinase n=1 Tax=Rubrivirga sp. TaxID=1885344 RepID=UPI003C78087A
MTSDRWSRIADLFDRAADLDPSERAAFLDLEAVGPDGATDGALREEVERLLAADLQDEFLDGTVGPDREAPPPTAGPWRLDERVGRGGMGEVWRAHREGAFEQAAAVKLVRPGLGESLVARFRSERQILAGLDHPSIARLLDGGKASDGRPYLATEFIEGEPITTYCDTRRLGVNERLAVFAEVCDAVAYAHTRLVVHRDLKPSNVMVTDRGRVKLLDFGIAKLLDADGDGLTRTGRPVLTPAYAAPEQAGGGAITTATDV